MIRRSILLLTLALAATSAGEERAPVEPRSLPAPDQAVEPVKPNVEKLDANRFRIGKVTFNRSTREVRFPARVNMTEGLLEFLVVHENGKVHESLFITDTSPTDINLALTLLRYTPSRELYPLPNETGGVTDKYPEVPAEVRDAARVVMFVEREESGTTRRVPANEWIQHAVKSTHMPSGPWVYGGSEFHDGKFVPETTGDIIAIFVAPSALINYPGEDNRDDTVWLAYPKRVPAEGTQVQIVIAPHKNPSNPAKP